MAKRAGWVNQFAGQTGYELKTGSGQSDCGSGWVDPYFHMIFFYLRKHVFVIWKVVQQIT